MSSRDSVREWLVVYLKGLFMGAADAVPGVSGGTIALIVGIYERLITAITSLNPGVVRHLPKFGDPTARAALRRDLAEMDVAFLIVLGAGIATAIASIAQVMEVALAEFPAFTYAFFFGLIAASAVVLYQHVAIDTPRRLAVAVFGFTIAFVISGASTTGGLPNSLPFVFVTGAIAIVGMILPGISGAFFLILLGQYDFLTSTLNEFVGALAGLVAGGSVAAVVEPGIVVLTFGIGGLIGLFSVAYAVRWALSAYREATLTFLVSLMVGGLRLPAVKVLQNTPDVTPMAVGGVLAVAVVGGALVLLVDRFTEDIEFA
jgi:putative membrane protein